MGSSVDLIVYACLRRTGSAPLSHATVPAGSAGAEDVQRLTEQLANANERSRVLRRIVSDDRYRLEQKFEDLEN